MAGGGLTSTSNAIDIAIGMATQLAFAQQPSATTASAVPLASQPRVAVQDAGGNTVTSDSGSVTLAISAGTGTSGATLSCAANPATATAGVATFTGCKIDKAGSGYTLTATRSSLGSAVSTTFAITPGPAAKLAFNQQPSGSTGGIAFATQPKVEIQDAQGNTVAGDTSSVSLPLNAPAGVTGATLACTANPVSASSSLATFAGCKVNKEGTGDSLTAASGSLTTATSTFFNITP